MIYSLVVVLTGVTLIGATLEENSDFNLNLQRNEKDQVRISFIPTSSLTYKNISERCFGDSQIYIETLSSQQPKSALLMFTSSGKLHDGFIHSLISSSRIGQSYLDFGLFDQCLDARISEELPAKYCSVFFRVVSHDVSASPSVEIREENFERPTSTYDPSRIHDGVVALCVPSSCSAKDVRSAVTQHLAKQAASFVIPHSGSYFLKVYTDDDYCHTGDDVRVLDGYSISMIGVLCVLGLLILLATIREVAGLGHEGAVYRFLHCFSAVSNGRTLWSTETTNSDHLSCLHGIKVLTCLWIILHHLSNEMMHRYVLNRSSLAGEPFKLENQWIVNGFVTVDTFFLISGLLVAFSVLRDLDQDRFSLKSFYLHRLIRLMPVYAIVFGFVATVVVHLGSGPDWTYMDYISKDCRSTWWANLMFINNFMPTTFCMTEAWYVACEMQMFLLSPLFIYPLWKSRRAGLTWILCSIALFISANIAIHIIWDLPPTILPTRPTMMKDILTIYGRINYPQAYTRFPPYLIGIFLGWILHTTKNQRLIPIHKGLVMAGWVLSAAAGCLIIFGLFPYLREDLVPNMNDFVRVIYGSFHHVIWASAVGWTIFACVHGHGGIINRILSSKIFIPFSRLTYAAYLIHFNYIKFVFSNARQPTYADKLEIFLFYTSVLLVSFSIAAVVSIVVEIPFLNADRLLLSKNNKGRRGATGVRYQATSMELKSEKRSGK